VGFLGQVTSPAKNCSGNNKVVMRVALAAVLLISMHFASSLLRVKHLLGGSRLSRLSMTTGATGGADVNYKVGFMFPGQGGD
jgi:hypothetical protein